MLTVIDIQTIVHLYCNGAYSRRGIARKLGISRTAVDKVLAQYEATQETSDNEALENLLTLQSADNSQGRKPRKLSEAIAVEIDKYLELNRQRRTKGMRKQQMKKIDIRQDLARNGVWISYQTVCRYSTCKENMAKESDTKAYIRQAYAPGQECEFDRREVKIAIGGSLRKLYLAVFTCCHSNLRRPYLFSRQDTLAFMESHRNFFRQLQWVLHLIRHMYDSHFTHEPKEFPELLQYAKDNGYHFRNITDAASRLDHLSADQIKDLLHGQCSQIEQLASDAISEADDLLNPNVPSIKTVI